MQLSMLACDSNTVWVRLLLETLYLRKLGIEQVSSLQETEVWESVDGFYGLQYIFILIYLSGVLVIWV
jgi:hypothetical protein